MIDFCKNALFYLKENKQIWFQGILRHLTALQTKVIYLFLFPSMTDTGDYQPTKTNSVCLQASNKPYNSN